MAESSAYGPKAPGKQPAAPSTGLPGEETGAPHPSPDSSDRTVISTGRDQQLADDDDRTFTSLTSPARPNAASAKDAAAREPGTGKTSAEEAGAKEAGPAHGRPEQAAATESESSHGSRRPGRSDDRTVISSQPPLPAPAAGGSPINEALLGEWLDHFELLEFVGGGGMGVVFRARDSRLDRIVALKILSTDRARDRETVRRFQNEAQSAARLDHENIARVYYVGEDRGLNYIAFEFVDGTNIRDMVMERGPLPVAEAVSYMMQLAYALAHASGRNVIHRDIKPSNVLVTRDGRVKLVDMGLARLSQVEQTEDITASGVTLGTFDYISPEQARDPRNADVRSDIYSLGCTFYFMLTGRPPFPHGNVLQKLLQHHGETPPDPRDTNPEIPEDVVRVLRRLLVKDPARRYQDAQALILDLSRLADQLGLDFSNLGTAYIAREPSLWMRAAYRHLPWLVPVAALTVALFGLDALWRSRAATPEPFVPAPHLSQPVQASEDEPRGSNSGDSTAAASRSTSPPRTVAANFDLPPLDVVMVAPINEAALDQLEQDSGLAMSPTSVKLTVADFSSDAAAASVGNPSGTAGSAELASAGAALDGGRNDRGAGSRGQGVGRTGDDQSGNGTSGDSGSSTGASASGMAAIDNAGFGLTYPHQISGGSSAAAVPHPEGVLVVRPDADASLSYQYASLADACNAAEAGDVIELHYSGRRREPPIRIARGLTIRAGQKAGGESYRPVVVFSPDAVGTSRTMVSVSGARLSLQNVAVEMNLPAGGLNGAWTMAELQQGELEAENCTFTLSRPQGHETPSFFRVRSDQRGESMMMSSTMLDPAPRRGVGRVRLTNCIARGEAVLVFAEHMAPLALEWRNGLFASMEALLAASGGVTEPLGSRLALTLDHITALIPGGLCVLETSDDYPRSLPLEVQCTNSVLVGTSGMPLIEVSAAESVSLQKSQVSWQGSSNVYDGFTTFWRIRDRSLSEPPVDLNASLWQEYWETREQAPFIGPVLWKNRSPLSLGVSLDQHSPRDYLVDEEFQSRHTSGDDVPAGFQPERLPPTDLPAGASGESSAALGIPMPIVD